MQNMIEQKPFTVLKPKENLRPVIQGFRPEREADKVFKKRRKKIVYVPETKVYRSFKPSELNFFGL